MTAVRREAWTPAPVPFPWLRVLPGLAISAVALAALLIIALAEFQTGALAAGPIPLTFANIINFARSIGLGWIVLALFTAFAPPRLVFATK